LPFAAEEVVDLNLSLLSVDPLSIGK